MSKNTISAGEFLAQQSRDLTNFSEPVSELTKATSFRLSASLDASIKAISELTDLSRNRVIHLLLEEAVKTYEEDITGDQCHERYRELVKEGLEK